MSLPSGTDLNPADPIPDNLPLVRSPHLALAWENNRLVATKGTDGRRLSLTPAIVAVLHELSEPADLIELRRRHPTVRQGTLNNCVRTGLLVPADTVQHDEWSPLELALQRRTGRGGKKSEVLDHDRMPPGRIRRGGSTVPLPEASTPRRDAADLLNSRRSTQWFEATPISTRQLGSLLGGSARVIDSDEVTGRSWRPYPSASARHPLEIFVVARAVDGLQPGSTWYYDPFDNALRSWTTLPAEHADNLLDLAGGTCTIGEPAALLLITAVFARTTWKYGDLGLTLVYRDVGCLLQTLYHNAALQELGGKALGGGPELPIATSLGLDPIKESLVGTFITGHGQPGRTGHRD